MSDTEVVLQRLDGLEKMFGERFERMDRNIARIFERLDKEAELGHEVRIRTLEKRLDGQWAKITGLIALLGSAIAWAIDLFRGSAK